MRSKLSKTCGTALSLTLLLVGIWAGSAQAQMPEAVGGPGAGGPAAFAGGQMVRGTVTAVAADKISVKTEAGEIYQVALSANTRLMKARQPVKFGDIKAGDGLGAMGVLDVPMKTVHAVFVTVIDAEDVKKAREGMGKVYIVGKVTAIDEVKLTILRTDGVSQAIEVDETTSFKKGGRGLAMMMNGGGMGMGGGGGRSGGEAPANAARPGGGAGESITLADVKVGDTVAGQGAVKHGVFVPTELGVMDPAATGQRRRRPNTDSGGTGPAPAGPVGVAPPQ
ncbi:MAG: hypothetical protein JWM43_636 [Acidobacteriaceae bacterium]|nr:hypothetical protein [Acidobacteriaceae bacterium]